MRLSGKTALVTGAGSGIGEATAVLFGQEKANVVISDIQEKEGESTSDLIISDGGTAKFVSGDVSVPKDAKNIVEKAKTKDFFANPKSNRTKLFLSQIL